METTATQTIELTQNAGQVVRMVGQDVGFERIRRITGYLVGTLDRFNDAKRTEESERTKHNISRRVEL